MRVPTVSHTYFSENRKTEFYWRLFCWLIMAAIAAILIIYWEFLGLQKLIEPLFYFQAERVSVEYLFRGITFLGDDEFYMIFISILLWCVHKSLAFWTAVVLLLSAAYTFYFKDFFGIPRPDLGIEHPGNDAFPSGHTLTALTVWGYLAVRLRSTAFWTWAVIIIVLIGFSRLILGYHFVSDVLGGLVLGFIFLALFVWLSALFVEKGWVEKFTFPALLIISIVVPVILTILLPDDITRLMGYLAGISIGYVLERKLIAFSPQGKWYQHIIKSLMGAVVLFGIVMGLSSFLPSDVIALGFIRYALAGFWVTFLAPLLFASIGLAARENKQA